MDDPGLARRRKPPALGRHRAGAAADKDDEIGQSDDAAGRQCAAIAADNPDRERVVVADAAVAADRRRHRCTEPFGDRLQLGFGAGDDDTAPDDEQRVLGGEQ